MEVLCSRRYLIAFGAIFVSCASISLLGTSRTHLLGLHQLDNVSSPALAIFQTSSNNATRGQKVVAATKYIQIEGPTWYLKLLGQKHYLPHCPYQCLIINNMKNKSNVPDVADAIVWNGLTHSPNSGTKPFGQRWVFAFWIEARSGKSWGPGHARKIGSAVDWTMTYSRQSDIFHPQFRILPRKPFPEFSVRLAPLRAPSKKPALLAWVVSNCKNERGEIFMKIARHLPHNRIQIFGRCSRFGSNYPCKGNGAYGFSELFLDKNNPAYKCVVQLWGLFKFYFAVENTRCEGYITEKLQRAYVYGMVPVVLSGLSRKDTEALVPGDSFIHVDDFPSAKALANHLLALDRDDAAYGRYLAWRTKRAEVLLDTMTTTRGAFCELCQKLHNTSDRAVQVPSAMLGNQSLENWWFNKSACKKFKPKWSD